MGRFRRMIQRVKCKIPFSPHNFHHAPLVVERQLYGNCQLIRCESCGKRFAINHSVRAILPWPCVADLYDETGDLFIP